MNSIDHQPHIVGSASPLTHKLEMVCRDETATQSLAQRLAVCPALAQATITLHGDLGAGKTTFVRHLLRALGVQGRIKSPTYAVVEPHEAPAAPGWPGGLRVSHFDFYRFNDPREWEDAGFRELFADPGLKLVEWPEKAQGLMPTPDLAITLQATETDEARDITIEARTTTGLQLLEAVRA